MRIIFAKHTNILRIMSKSDMILALIEHYSNGNKAQFASRLGITPQGLSTWIKRNTFDAELIFSKCEGVSAKWLLTGEGELIAKNHQTKIEENAREDENNVAHPAQNPKEGIPLIPFSAMAGALTGEQSVLEYECERYVIPAFNGADFLMPVKGNSMMPTYISGDIVACQRVPMSGLFFQWNKPYVLDTAQGAIIKRIKPGSDKQHVLIVSDNKEYDPFELPYEDIYAVALVIGIIRLE